MQNIVRATIFGFRIAPILLVIYWILLFTGTHLPGVHMPKLGHNDKLMHFGAFAGLAFLMAWTLPKKIGKGVPGMLVAAVIILAYAAIDELTQGFVPRRSPDILDFVADTAGMFVGFAAYLTLRTLLYGYLARVEAASEDQARRQATSSGLN